MENNSFSLAGVSVRHLTIIITILITHNQKSVLCMYADGNNHETNAISGRSGDIIMAYLLAKKYKKKRNIGDGTGHI